MGSEQSILEEEQKFVNSIKEKTKFTEEELKKKTKIFYQLFPDGKIKKTEFVRDCVEIVGGKKIVWSRVFDSFDGNQNGNIELKDYFFACALIRWGSFDEKLKWFFSVFDQKANGTLNMKEVTNFVEVMIATGNKLSLKLFQDVTGKAGTQSLKWKKKQDYAGDLFDFFDLNKNGLITPQDIKIRCKKDRLYAVLFTVSITNTFNIEDIITNRRKKPQNVEKFKAQVAGHSEKPKEAFVKKGKYLLKPLNEAEYYVYEYIYHQAERNISKHCKELKTLIPKYLGRTFIKKKNEITGMEEITHYLEIEDLTEGLKKPCIIDIKMGNREYSDDDSAKKKFAKVIYTNLTTSAKLGYRICGGKHWDEKQQEYIKLGKTPAFMLSVQQVEDYLCQFVDNGIRFRRRLYMAVVKKLEVMLKWFKKQNEFCFYASSILIVYDGGKGQGDEVKVIMIDFAHTQKLKNRSNSFAESLIASKTLLKKQPMSEDFLKKKRRKSYGIAFSSRSGESSDDLYYSDSEEEDEGPITITNAGNNNSKEDEELRDDSYIFGLVNLIAKLKEIANSKGKL